jgi:hypothetical protein
VEVVVAAAEAGVGQDAALWLADDGGADEVPRLVQRKEEEDALDEIVNQHHRWRRHATAEARVLDWEKREDEIRLRGLVQAISYLTRFASVTN